MSHTPDVGGRTDAKTVDGRSAAGAANTSRTRRRHMWLLACAVLALAFVPAVLVGPVVRAQNAIPTGVAPRQFLPLVLAGAQAPAAPGPTLVPLPPATPLPTGMRASDFGLVWVNSAEQPSSPTRIQRGVDAGAKLDRFPLYWNLIETSAGQYTWSSQDAALAGNEARGLGTLAILLGEPSFYYPALLTPAGGGALPPVGGSFLRNNGGSRALAPAAACTAGGPPAPRGLYNPIFNDGSDRPGASKGPNPANPWAIWVGQVVDRYKPGGSAGLHVRYWEVWNEEDLCQFWTGSAADYARLLEVAYLVIHQRDPGATVVWGGLAHYEQPQFLYDLINALVAAPMSAEFGGFFDAAAGHHYSILWNGYQWTARVRAALNTTGWGAKPIWITESGVPVCNDFPGPNCPSPWRATPIEQATWMWENLAYSRLAGGGPIFQFALHDDCGNVVSPTSPDGFGLVKNESASYCSPANAQLRPSYTAYQLANRYFAGTELRWGDVEPGSVPRARRVAFYEPVTKQRRTLVWALDGPVTTTLAATGDQAVQIGLDGSRAVLSPVNGAYTLALPGSTNLNNPDGTGGYTAGIYGVPYLLIETDIQAPLGSITGLPATVGVSFPVTWTVSDRGAGLARVALYFQKDAGPWQLWWSGLPDGDGVTATGTMPFRAEANHRYRFAAAGTDRAGNSVTTLAAQAETWVSDNPPSPQPVIVSGQVLDVHGSPAAGAAVRVGPAGTSTDGAGHFQLAVMPGRWDVSVGGRTAVYGQGISAATSLDLLLRPTVDAVTNGDFEAGLAGWQTGGSCPLAVEVRPGTQDHDLHLATAFVPNPSVPGEEGSWGGNSTVSQPLHVPAGRPALALRYKVDSQETVAGHDRFEIIVVRNSQANYVYTQGTGSDWRTLSLDLSAFADSDVTLIFNVYQSSPYRPTEAYLDLVSVGQ